MDLETFFVIMEIFGKLSKNSKYELEFTFFIIEKLLSFLITNNNIGKIHFQVPFSHIFLFQKFSKQMACHTFKNLFSWKKDLLSSELILEKIISSILPLTSNIEIKCKFVIFEQIINLMDSHENFSKTQKFKLILNYSGSFQNILTILNEYDFFVIF